MNQPSRSTCELTDDEIIWKMMQMRGDEDWADLLEQLCGGDEDRHQRLSELLQNQDAAEQLFGGLDEPSHSGGQGKRTRVSRADTPHESSAVLETPSDLGQFAAPKAIGRYRVVRFVGSGGMGNVFHARDDNLARDVAIKIPRMDLLLAPGVGRRFIREARVAANLDHPHLVSVIEVGSEGPIPFIASQWCGGGDLATWLRKRGQSNDPADVARFGAKIAAGVQHCHDRGVVHLDLKPSNILLMKNKVESAKQYTDRIDALDPRISDFGLARLLDQQLSRTSTSMFLGTPLYMAPEQAECNRELIGPRSDVFTLGVILYELMTGVRPFDGNTVTAVMDLVRQSETPRSSGYCKLPRDVRVIISRCLQRDPADRYATARDLADDLLRFANRQPISIRPVSMRRRFWLWCSRSERITQAGAVTVAIQLAVLGNLYSHFVLAAFGFRLDFYFDRATFFWETIPITLFPHLPLLINGIRTLRHRRHGVLIGTALSIIFVWALAAVLMGQEPAFSAYDNNPLAAYVAHLFIFCLAMVQLLVHAIAIPAAIEKSMTIAAECVNDIETTF